MYLGLAVAPANWYNTEGDIISYERICLGSMHKRLLGISAGQGEGWWYLAGFIIFVLCYPF